MQQNINNLTVGENRIQLNSNHVDERYQNSWTAVSDCDKTGQVSLKDG